MLLFVIIYSIKNKYKKIIVRIKSFQEYNKSKYSEKFNWVVESGIPLQESFRMHSESYSQVLREARTAYIRGYYFPQNENERFILEDLDTGEKAVYNGEEVTLDLPEETPRGDEKQFQVYVDTGKKDKEGNKIAKKIKFGSADYDIKNCDDDARKSFLARHQCDKEDTSDKDAGFWSCNIHRFADELGLECDKPW
jgi:hypothetical protein